MQADFQTNSSRLDKKFRLFEMYANYRIIVWSNQYYEKFPIFVFMSVTNKPPLLDKNKKAFGVKQHDKEVRIN